MQISSINFNKYNRPLINKQNTINFKGDGIEVTEKKEDGETVIYEIKVTKKPYVEPKKEEPKPEPAPKKPLQYYIRRGFIAAMGVVSTTAALFAAITNNNDYEDPGNSSTLIFEDETKPEEEDTIEVNGEQITILSSSEKTQTDDIISPAEDTISTAPTISDDKTIIEIPSDDSIETDESPETTDNVSLDKVGFDCFEKSIQNAPDEETKKELINLRDMQQEVSKITTDGTDATIEVYENIAISYDDFYKLHNLKEGALKDKDKYYNTQDPFIGKKDIIGPVTFKIDINDFKE